MSAFECFKYGNQVSPQQSEPGLSAPPPLALPGLELVYLWNGFSIMGLQYARVERYLVTVEQEMERAAARRLQQAPDSFTVEEDCLLLLLRGMCLKYMSAPLAAEENFRAVIDR